MRIMTDWQFKQARNDYCGFCSFCDEITDEGGVEPDAEKYECPECGKYTLMGMEAALLDGLIVIRG